MSLQPDFGQTTVSPNQAQRFVDPAQYLKYTPEFPAVPPRFENDTPVTMENLESLVLCVPNRLTWFPSYIFKLTNLTYLGISCNEMKSLSDGITILSKLRKFSIQNNEITSVPENFSALTTLEYLDFSGNQISSLPESLSKLTALTYLNVDENPLSKISTAIIQIESLKSFIVPMDNLEADTKFLFSHFYWSDRRIFMGPKFNVEDFRRLRSVFNKAKEISAKNGYIDFATLAPIFSDKNLTKIKLIKMNISVLPDSY